MSKPDLLATARACHQRGDLERAFQLYSQILRKTPRHADALGGLGLIHFQRDRYPEAVDCLQQALKDRPRDPGLLLNLGNCHQALGDLPRATEAFRAAAAAAGPFPQAHLNLGNVLCQRGLTHEAIGEYRTALGLRPQYPLALRRLALALAAEGAGSDDYDILLEASTRLTVVLSQTPGDADAERAWAQCEWRLARYGRDMGRFKAAVARLERLADGDLPQARTELARLALDLDDGPTALAAALAGAPLPAGWAAKTGSGLPSTWSDGRPLHIHEERDGLLLTGQRDWLVLRPGEVLRSEDMTNANPAAGQYVRVVAPLRRLILALPPEGAPLPEAVLIGGLNNYYHWLLDYLPRLRLVLERANLAALPLIVNAELAPFQRETLARLGVAEDRLLPLAAGQALRFERLWVPDLGSLQQRVHPDTLAWLRRSFGETPCRQGRRLWLSRADASQRRVVNEDEVVAALAGLGFETVLPGGLSVAEQARLFAEAETVVAPHGAALTNLLFCRPGTRVVELMPGRHRQLGFFPGLSKACGHLHDRVECEPRPTPEQQAATAPQNFDMYVPLDKLRAVLG